MDLDSTVNILELLSVCVSLAEHTGDVIRHITKEGNLHIVRKDEFGNQTDEILSKNEFSMADDAVTIADITTQQIIEGTLRKIYPNIRLIGEEEISKEDFQVVDVSKDKFKDVSLPENFQLNLPEKDIVIYVDPIDATSEYIKGSKLCSMTLIGISYQGRAFGGVVNAPFANDSKGKLVWALEGFKSNFDEIRVQQEPRNETILVTSKSHSSPALLEMIQKLHVDKVIHEGGAGYKIMHLVESIADVYCYPVKGTKKWDTCAPEAILKFYGGCITDSYGKEIDYADTKNVHNAGILATRKKEDHPLYLSRLLC